MEPVRIESCDGAELAARRSAEPEDGADFEAVLREVDEDLVRLRRLAEDARRVASDDGPEDPEVFREAVRESAEALRSARRIRSRLLGAYRATERLRG
jgi:hypothetical protein